MTECIDQGLLMVYLLEGELTPQPRAAVEAHLAGCPACREQLRGFRTLDTYVTARMSTLDLGKDAALPDVQAAWLQMQSRITGEHPALDSSPIAQLANKSSTADGITVPLIEDRRPATPNRRKTMQSTILMRPRLRRALFSGLAAVLVLSFVAFPSLRAAADSILQVFRVQSTVFMPVDADRLHQLASLNFDMSSLFLSNPSINKGGLKRAQVASVAEAAQAVGFTPQQIGSLPSAPSFITYGVYSSAHMSATLNVEALRSILSLLNINDVTLPDALSQAPVTADLPPSGITRYHGVNYDLTFVEGPSPNVTMPGGVMLSDLGEAGLRVLGMDAAQAAEMSNHIDWSSTLVVPFPSSLNTVKQVQFAGVQGLMVAAGQSILPMSGTAPDGSTMLYWQRGDHFYVLVGQGSGMDEQALIDAAGSAN